MKKICSTNLLAGLLTFCLMIGLTSCEEKVIKPTPPEPEVSVEAVTTGDSFLEFNLSASNSDEMAFFLLENTEGHDVPDAEDIFNNGIVYEVSDEPVLCRVEELTYETPYIIYAAASKEGKYSKVETLEMVTIVPETYLSFVSSTKKSFTYKISVPEGKTFQHTYIQGWLYDYLLSRAQQDDGDEFDMDVFRWNLLIDYGIEATGPQEITWTAGDYDAKRDDKALIVGGHKFYALFSFYDGSNPEEAWKGTPEAVSFELEEAGESSSTVNIIDELVSSEKIRVRMELDPSQVSFMFYNLYSKDSYDSYLAENGEKGLKDYMFEYGYSASNTYTDSWTVEGGKSYVLVILGVDPSGDTFLATKQYDVPELQPQINITMQPYNRELQGYYSYNTFQITVEPENFKGEIDPYNVTWNIMDKETLDIYLGMFMMTSLEDLDKPEFESFRLMAIGSLCSQYLPTEQQNTLKENGYFKMTYSDCNPSTEYYYLCAIITGDDNNRTYEFSYAKATTEAQYGGGSPEAGYQAYLGEWTLTGKTTKDYSTNDSYTLCFETLTPNRSFKVYGWGHSDVAQNYPFEVRYNPDTQKISIEGEQILGTTETSAGEMEVVFTGLFSYRGYLNLVSGYSGELYSGGIIDGAVPRLSLFPNFIKLPSGSFEFQTMAYSGYMDGEFYTFEGDDYEIVNFTVEKSASSSSVSTKKAGNFTVKTAPRKVTAVK